MDMGLRFSAFLLVLIVFLDVPLSGQEQDYRPIKGSETKTPPPPPLPPAEAVDTKSKEAKTENTSSGKWDWQNFRLGGNLGLSFGNVTYLDISPTFGYFVIPQKLQVGIGTKFVYYNRRQEYSLNTSTTIPPYRTFIYGGGFFSNYTIWEGVFAHAEFEMVNKDSYYDINRRVNVPHLLLGGGYMQPIGENGHFFIAALFNVLDSDESLYAGTFGSLPLIIRTGVGFGFPGRR